MSSALPTTQKKQRKANESKERPKYSLNPSLRSELSYGGSENPKWMMEGRPMFFAPIEFELFPLLSQGRTVVPFRAQNKMGFARKLFR